MVKRRRNIAKPTKYRTPSVFLKKAGFRLIKQKIKKVFGKN